LIVGTLELSDAVLVSSLGVVELDILQWAHTNVGSHSSQHMKKNRENKAGAKFMTAT